MSIDTYHANRIRPAPATTPTPFGDALTRLRIQRGLSMSKLGLAAGTNYSHVSRLEGGSRQPSRDTVIALATALDLNHHRALALHLAAFVPDSGILREVVTERALHRTPDDAGLSGWTVELMAELAEIGTAARDRDAETCRYGLVRLAALAIQAIEEVDAMDVVREEVA